MYLFHYTNSESALKIIEDNKFFLSKIDKLNDPLENKNINFYANSFEKENINYITQELNRIKNLIINVASFSVGKFIEVDDISILSLLKERPGYFYPRMWSQYGDKHNGVCLVYNFKKLMKSFNIKYLNDYHIFHGKVEYVDIVHELAQLDYAEMLSANNLSELQSKKLFKYVIDVFFNDSMNIFLKKDNDWYGEKEYRWLLLNKDHNKSLKLNKLFIESNIALHAIVLGIENKNNQKLIELSRYNKSIVYKLDYRHTFIEVNELY